MNRRCVLRAALAKFSVKKRLLPGVTSDAALDTLAMQMVASLRRLDYTNIIKQRAVDPARADPASSMFDPERAAIFHAQNGNLNEAVWLIFLATHFGKHPRHGWRRLRDVYSELGRGLWNWGRVSQNVTAFQAWLDKNQKNIGGAFGNHRKYESLNGSSSNGTGAAVASYIKWIGPARSHAEKFAQLIQESGNDPEVIFDHFYKDMDVQRFGRLGKFDFLALLGRLDFAPICPGKTYLAGATGPMNGARLLFGGSPQAELTTPQLEEWIKELDEELHVGMQVMEDALCNWQKSPQKFVHFKG